MRMRDGVHHVSLLETAPPTGKTFNFLCRCKVNNISYIYYYRLLVTLKKKSPVQDNEFIIDRKCFSFHFISYSLGEGNKTSQKDFSLFFILKIIIIIHIYNITSREQQLKMCKISLLNGSIITIIISKQKTTAERTKQPIRRWRQHLGNIITFKKQTQTNKKKTPTVNITWLCLLTLCLQMKYRLETHGCLQYLGIYIQYQSRLTTA